MKYIKFDENGQLTGRYDDAVNTSIPAGAVAVSDELFARTITESDGVWVLVDGEVVKQSIALATLKARKSAEIEASYNANLNAGLTIGTDIYPTGAEARTNMNGTILLSLLLQAQGEPYKFTVFDTLTQSYSFKDHTTAEIQLAGVTVANHVRGLVAKAVGLQEAIAAATTAEELDAVVW